MTIKLSVRSTLNNIVHIQGEGLSDLSFNSTCIGSISALQKSSIPAGNKCRWFVILGLNNKPSRLVFTETGGEAIHLLCQTSNAEVGNDIKEAVQKIERTMKEELEVQKIEFTENEIKELDKIAIQQDLSRIQTLRQALRLYQMYHSGNCTVTFPNFPKKTVSPEEKFFIVIDPRDVGEELCRLYGIFTTKEKAEKYIKEVEDNDLVIEEWMRDIGE